MNAQDALVRGQKLNDQFSYHLLDTMGPELVHVTRSYRPEIVVFGQDQQLVTPFIIEAGKDIMLTGKDDRVTVSRFVPNESDQKRVVSTRLDECIRAMTDLGDNYPDVVQALQQAKQKGALQGRFAIDAIPSGGRRYDRGSASASQDLKDGNAEATEDAAPNDEDEEESGDDVGVAVANPLPGLFENGSKTFDRPATERPLEVGARARGEEFQPVRLLVRYNEMRLIARAGRQGAESAGYHSI